jgi:uncharacterized membrane protein (Fun14 family)
MESLIPPILLALVIGGVAGYFAGHLFKRVSGMALTIAILVAIAVYLIAVGTLNIQFDSVIETVTNFVDMLGPLGLTSLASSVPFVASFVAGIFIGYRRY